MANAQFTFKRYEEKYLLVEKQFDRLKKEMERYMEADPHGNSTVCNIYYDTDNYELIRHSLEKPVYKEKFRVRSYGVPKDDDEVFVEIKKKYDGVVYKRRVSGNPASARAFTEEGKRLSDNRQIQEEIIWFLHHYQPKPKMFIGYERTAFFGKEDYEFRLTFDRNIRYRLDCLDLQKGDAGTAILPEGKVLMEVKTLDAAPMWLADYLNKEKLYPVSFSKYGSCYMRELKLRQEAAFTMRISQEEAYKKNVADGNWRKEYV